MGIVNRRFYADIMDLHEEVTGSCHLVVVKLPNGRTIKFLVDCGLFQEPQYEELNSNFTFNADELDFVCVTHNHTDHTGRVPMLYHQGYSGKVYCTIPTRSLMPLSMIDNYKVLKEAYKRAHKKQIYTEVDVDRALSNLEGCKYGEKIVIDENIEIKFLKNGHLLGASMILVRIKYPDEQDMFILFTGDYKPSNVFFDVDPLPEWVKKLPLTMITESTYGIMTTDEIEYCFEDNILEAIQANKDVILPVFSLGRCQEILYILRCLQREGKLPASIPIYFDGPLAHSYTKIYLDHPEWLHESMREFLPVNLRYVQKQDREDIVETDQQKIIVTTGGMVSHGPIQYYLPEFIERSNVLIHLTGYCAEGTLGRVLKETEYGNALSLSGITVLKEAEVKDTNEFSGHAKADELIELLKQFDNIQTVLINHGEHDEKFEFSKIVKEEINPSHHVAILDRQHYYRIGQYGLIKVLNTKFL